MKSKSKDNPQVGLSQREQFVEIAATIVALALLIGSAIKILFL